MRRIGVLTGLAAEARLFRDVLVLPEPDIALDPSPSPQPVRPPARRRRVGILTGLAAEARVFNAGVVSEPEAALTYLVACTGADTNRASLEAARLINLGVSGLVSFGLAGGLHDGLRAGDLVIADKVVFPDGRSVATDAAWTAAVVARQDGRARAPLVGAVAGTRTLLATVDDKRRMALDTGAVATDMESMAIALVAERAGLPFLVVRAVSDDSNRTLPKVARIPLKPCGSVRLDQVLRTIGANPREWPAVARLTVDTHIALRALGGVARSGALGLP